MAPTINNQNKIKSELNGGTSSFKVQDLTAPQQQIKMLDGNLSEKERRQMVMKLIQFMKAV